MRNSNQLTARAVSSKKEPGRYGDGGGLYLQVSKFGTKSWIYRYMLDGRARHMGLGAIDLVSLAEARDTARECRKLLREGNDPIEARNANLMARRLEASKSITFKECAEKYIDTNEAGWSNPKHRKQWRSTLETYAYPVIGDFSAAAVDTDLVLKILEPIWSAKPETASRVRGRIENILDWATVLKYREGDNPARWRGNLNKLLPPTSKVRRTKHHEALPYEQLPDFMHDLWAREGTARWRWNFLS